MRLKKAWSTHIPMLLKYVQETGGPILELGAGIHSTPLLHWICAESNRRLVTYERNPSWFKFAKEYQSRNHSIHLVKNWDKVDFSAPSRVMDKTSKTHWSVAFLDHETERRYVDAVRLKDIADYLVLHDTHHPVYNYKKVWPHFKYVYHWKYCKPYTSVVSNFRNP